MDLRSRRNFLNRGMSFAHVQYNVANYSTDTQINKKTDMEAFDEDIFSKIHSIPDPLKKNLADTVITDSKQKENPPQFYYDATTAQEMAGDMNNEHKSDFYPSIAGITTFFSNFFGAISGAMFHRRPKSPASQYYDCFDSDSLSNDQMSPDTWQTSNTGDQNKIEATACPVQVSTVPNGTMNNCRAAAAHCEGKLNVVRSLLTSKPVVNPSKYRSRRPKRAFVEPGSVEDSFEEDFATDDFVSLPSDSYVKHATIGNNQDHIFAEIDSPKMKTEIGCVQETTDIVKILPVNQIEDKPLIDNMKDLKTIDKGNLNTMEKTTQKIVKTTEKAIKQPTEIPIKQPTLNSKILPTEQRNLSSTEKVTMNVKLNSTEKSSTQPTNSTIMPTEQRNLSSNKVTTKVKPNSTEMPAKTTEIPITQVKQKSTENQNLNATAQPNQDLTVIKKEVISSCEDKMAKLKSMLQGKFTKPIPVETAPIPEPIERPKPPKAIPIDKKQDKRFKNPNRLVDKRKKTKLKKIIQDDMRFADEIDSEEISSIDNSPAPIHSLQRIPEPLSESVESDKEYFDELKGRFQSTSTTDSDDSFQIVFTNSPKQTRMRRPSDCESEDSFVVFEDSPDSCYTSNDVFGDQQTTDDSDYEDSDSESEVNDSGCGIDVCTISHTFSRTVSDLTDDSLYDETRATETDSGNSDEVDCAVIEKPVESVFVKPGLLIDDAKKRLRKDQPGKKVSFSEAPPKVHVMRVWAFAARQARCRHWEQLAADRGRFKRRIADVDMAVAWVLKPQHRRRVMFQRFMPWWNAEKRREAAEKKAREAAEKIAREEQEKMEEERLIAEESKVVEVEKEDDSKTVPEIEVGNKTVPEIAIGNKTVPEIAIGNKTVPEIAIGNKAVPAIAIGNKTVPAIATGNKTVPAIATGNKTVPAIAIGNKTVPAIATGNKTVPEIKVGNKKVPEVKQEKEDKHIETKQVNVATVEIVKGNVKNIEKKAIIKKDVIDLKNQLADLKIDFIVKENVLTN